MNVGYVEVTFTEYPAHAVLSFWVNLSFLVKTRYLANKDEI